MADQTVNTVNAAPTDASGKEIKKIVPLNAGDGEVNGTPSTPGLSRGVVINTWIAKTNSDIAHVCDFVTELQKNQKLKEFLVAQGKKIRDAVRAVMRFLGFSDNTGVAQWLKDKLQTVTRELKRIQKEVIQPIIDFEKIAIEYVRQIQQIIQWIQSLPARFAAALADCLKKLVKLVGSVLTDIGTGMSEGGTGETGFSDVVKAAKETSQAFAQTVGSAVKAAAGAAAVAAAASTTISVGTIHKKGI
jgi:hypothetical protein